MEIEIQYSRKVTYNKIIEVDEETAQKLLALDGCDDNIYRNRELQELTDWCGSGDEFDEDDWLEDVQVKEYVSS